MSDKDYNPLLDNKLGLTNLEKIAEIERKYTTSVQHELKKNPIKGNFDYKHLKEIHKNLFEDVYTWAGKERTYNISKGNSQFAFTNFLDHEATKLFKELNTENNLKDLDEEQFIPKLAHYLSETNALHPFNEGNGRAMVCFFNQLTAQAGHDVDLTRIPQKQLNFDMIHAFNGNLRNIEESIKSLALKSTIKSNDLYVLAHDRGGFVDMKNPNNRKSIKRVKTYTEAELQKSGITPNSSLLNTSIVKVGSENSKKIERKFLRTQGLSNQQGLSRSR